LQEQQTAAENSMQNRLGKIGFIKFKYTKWQLTILKKRQMMEELWRLFIKKGAAIKFAAPELTFYYINSITRYSPGFVLSLDW
jgi:hypothetical protein